MSALGLRTIPMGINQNLNSCWLAATLQAIVDCPLLVNAILHAENYEPERVEIEKKNSYLEILTMMRNLIIAESALIQSKYPSDLYEKDKILKKGITVLKNYPIDESKLMLSDFDITKPDDEWYMTDKTFTMFMDLRQLPISRWISILEASKESLEELIKKKIIDLPFETLVEYYGIFSISDTKNIPLLWRSLEFNNLLKKYLYALIFNENTSLSCLNPQILKTYMFDSMTNVLCLLDNQIKLEFVDRVKSRTSNPLIFLSIMFENLRNTTFTKKLPLFAGLIINRGMSILLPGDITRFLSINSMIIDDKVVFDPQIKSIDFSTDKFTNEYNFLIITNSAISILRDAHTSLAEGAMHEFVTEQEINVFGVQYTLCSVIIHLGGIHYVTLTQVGEFNDGRFKLGNSKLQEFCVNSKYVEQTTMGPKYHPGYIWFYQKKIGISTEQIKINAHDRYKDELIYNELLEVCGRSSSDSQSTSAWYYKVGSQGENIIGKLMSQFGDYTIVNLIDTKYPEPEDYLKDLTNSEARRNFLKIILASSIPNLPQDSSTTLFASSELSSAEMLSLKKEMPMVNSQQFLECQRQQKAHELGQQLFSSEVGLQERQESILPEITPDDLLEEENGVKKIYKYFKKVNISQINTLFVKNFEGTGTAFDFFNNNYRQYTMLKFTQKFQEWVKAATDKTTLFLPSSSQHVELAKSSGAVDSLEVHEDWLKGNINGISYHDMLQYEEDIDKKIFKMSIPKFIETYKNDSSKYSSIAKNIEEAEKLKKPADAAQSSRPTDDEYWKSNPKIKEQIINLAGADAHTLEFNLSPFDLLNKLPEYSLKKEQVEAIGPILADTFVGGYSNYKKYLKYKNKYLQLKRMEKK
jgi:hypothetical protein